LVGLAFGLGDRLGCFELCLATGWVVLGRVVFGLTTGSMLEIQDHEFVATSSGSSVVDERIGCDKSWMFGYPVLVLAF
jgi:hypothetical protein